MNASRTSQLNSSASYKAAPTRSVSVDGVDLVYRELGPSGGVPVIFLNHLAAVLDNWDPRVVDGIAAERRVITFDNRGVGASHGSTPDTVEAMAHDAVAFIRTLGFDQVDLLGFSMGGFIAQVIAHQEPELVRKIVLAGTGPAGGEGIDKVTALTLQDLVKGTLTLQDAKQFLFFTRTANGRQAGRDFLKRLKERTELAFRTSRSAFGPPLGIRVDGLGDVEQVEYLALQVVELGLEGLDEAAVAVAELVAG